MAGANSKTIELLRKYDFTIQKKYGQNFLIDDHILSGIVEAARVSGTDTVLEIGPGLGALTGALCRAAGRVIAVEVDRMLIPILRETLADYDNVTVINEDILKLDLGELLMGTGDSSQARKQGEAAVAQGIYPEYAQPQRMAGRIKVVANLPYYITTPILMELLQKADCIESITVMVQKEVAVRMQEGPGSKSYGALSLAVQYYAAPLYQMTVSRNCFLPKPDVDSAVIRLDIYTPEHRPVKPKNPDLMFRLIRAAFNQRRKTLVNAVFNSPELTYTKEQIMQAIRQTGKPETVRGEALTLEEFAALADCIQEIR